MSEWKKHKSPKQKIFEKFSANLEYLFQNWPIAEIILPGGCGYVCPIGFTMHSKEGLLNSFDDQLTVEHIPPDSLGGKPVCLVRKDINSKAGHTIDKALMEQINAELFLKGQARVRGKVLFKLQGLNHITTDITIQNGDRPNIWFNPGKKNMKLLKVNILDKALWDGHKIEMKFNLPGKNQDNRVAFLKYAYLLAFSKVGYALLFGPKKLINPHYEKVRQQIMEPKNEIIPFVPIFKNEGPKIDGLGIVVEPVEMKSLFVTFPLTWKGNTDYYTVFLPAPDEWGFAVYNQLDSFRNTKYNFKFKYHEIIPFNFWDSKEKAIMFHQAWSGLNNN